MALIAVTGAAGFIGSATVAGLNAAGYSDVIAVDTLGSGTKFKNLRAKQYRDIVEPMRFLQLMQQDTLRPDAVIHLGAITDTSEPDADLVLKWNTSYSHDLALECVRQNVRLIYASSASVYGDGAFGFSDDDSLTPSLLPLNPYAFSKWLYDASVLRMGLQNTLVGLRFFNVFGPNEYHKGRMASVIWHAYQQIQSTGTIKLFQSHRPDYQDGGQLRDFIYVKDVVATILWFLERPEANGIYNLGTGSARSFRDLAGAVFAALKREPSIEYIPTPENIRDAYQYFTEADLAKLRAAGCSQEFQSLEDSVHDYVTQYLAKGQAYL